VCVCVGVCVCVRVWGKPQTYRSFASENHRLPARSHGALLASAIGDSLRMREEPLVYGQRCLVAQRQVPHKKPRGN